MSEESSRKLSARAGVAPAALVVTLASLAALALLVTMLFDKRDEQAEAGSSLTLFCAAGMAPPVELIAAEYEARFGTRIELVYGGSGTLLAQLQISRGADLYLAGDDSFVQHAREEGLVAEQLDVAIMRPVIAYRAQDPPAEVSLETLVDAQLRVGLADPDAAAVGKVTRGVLQQAGLWEEAQASALVSHPTVAALANDLVVGSIDVAVIWDATASQYEELAATRLPELDAAPRHVTLGVTSWSTTPSTALHFARYLSGRGAGLEHFAAFGFEPVAGDVWTESPSVVLMSGAMLNAAIDDTVRAFELREGVRVERIYNGCGILVAQMRAGAHADAYFSCDSTFLDMVQERFDPGEVVTSNPMVLLTQQGNPEDVRALADLVRPGLRVGLAHPEKSALGELTRRLLVEEDLYETFMASGNGLVESATGDYLVNQLRTGSLDAVIVYASNAAAVREELHLAILPQPGATASQPFAIARDTAHAHLLERLQEALVSAESRRRFEALGFEWRTDQ